MPVKRLTAKEKAAIRRMVKDGLLVRKAGAPKRKAKRSVVAKKAAPAPPAEVKAEAAPKKVRPPKGASKEAIARRRARFRANAAKHREREEGELAFRTAGDVAKDVAVEAALWYTGTKALSLAGKAVKGGAKWLANRAAKKKLTKVAAGIDLTKMSPKALKNLLKFKPTGPGAPGSAYVKPKVTAKPKAKPKAAKAGKVSNRTVRSAAAKPASRAPAVIKRTVTKPKAKPVTRTRKPKDVAKPAVTPSVATLKAINTAASAGRSYGAPTATVLTGKAASDILKRAGIDVPKKAADRIKKAAEFVRKAKKVKKPTTARAAKPKKPRRQRRTQAAKDKKAQAAPAAAVAPLTVAMARKILTKAKMGIPSDEGKLLKKAARVLKKANKGAAPKVTTPKAAKPKAATPKTTTPKATKPTKAKAKTTAPEEKVFSPAEFLGYGKKNRKVLDTFFVSHGATTPALLVRHREKLEKALKAVNGPKISGPGLSKKIDGIRTFNFTGKSPGSTVVERVVKGPGRVAEGHAGETAAETAKRLDKLAERAVRDTMARPPKLPSYRVTSKDRSIKGISALAKQMQAGKISAKKFASSVEALIKQAPASTRAKFNIVRERVSTLEIAVKQGKASGKITPTLKAEIAALKEARADLQRIIASIAVMVGVGATAE